MGEFNKIISLFVGLFVVIFVIAFLLGRFKIGNNQAKPNLSGALGRVFNIPQPTQTPTPTPKTVTIKTTAQSTSTVTSPYVNSKVSTAQTGRTYQTPYMKTIPQTGPELFIPLVSSVFAAGAYLRKKE